jgi:outer membrane receptor protein involved in Fe transport
MKLLRSMVALLVLIFAASTAAWAGPGDPADFSAIRAPQTPPPAQQPPPPPPPPPSTPVTKPDQKYEETVVVSASKTEQKIVDAPATMSVFTPKFLANTPANNYGDLLRGVPGMNATQLSARDINLTSRGATSSLSTSQLAVLDGRSLYQDFFGFIMWDFMPANLNEIKQIEVIRGPASAVWGANALTGVVNITTKSPRENPGTSVTMGYGQFNKDVNGVDAKNGNVFFLNGTYAGIVNDAWSYKLTAGMYDSAALARPTGLIPNGGTTSYPAFDNQGTSQPKFDLRVDRDFDDGKKVTFSGGSAGTAGIMESGIGPFKIQNGTRMSYGKVGYTNKAFHVQAFMNALDGKAPNLLSIDPLGNPIQLNFNTKTFDIEAGDTRSINRNVFTYGGNLRYNQFKLTIAPGETSRTEGGVYAQDEIFINDHFRLVAGARVDKFSSIDKAVFSPRVALVMKPKDAHTFRLTYNRAFRAPSMINNNLDVTIATPLPLAAVNAALKANLFPATGTFLVPTRATGNQSLTEEHIDAYEASYTGRIGDKTVVSAAYYMNDIKDEIFFTVKENYALNAPPTGWTSLPQWNAAFGPAGATVATQVWGGVQASANFPKEYTYLNLGSVKQKGLELGIDSAFGPSMTYYVNYSYMWQPEPSFPGLTAAQALAEINRPAKTRFNYGMTTTIWKIFYTISASYSGKAFWQDVLDSRFHGETPAYTLSNLSIGTKWGKDRYTALLRVNNMGNVQVQQHIFGDVIKRQIVGEFRVNLPK